MERARGMETLRRDDIERARRTPPEEKAKQAFALMRFGIKLQRSRLRQAFPGESEEQIRQRLLRWMARDDTMPFIALRGFQLREPSSVAQPSHVAREVVPDRGHVEPTQAASRCRRASSPLR